MERDPTRLGVRMHGVTLTLEADHRPLIAYAAEHLGGLVEAPLPRPDLLVKCHWSEGEWDPDANPFGDGSGLNVVGNRMLGKTDELVWLNTLRMKGLQLRFRREDGQFLFEVSYRFRRKEEYPPEYEAKKYFSLMSYLVYHPIIWYLERTRGWTVLHASALDSARGGIVIGGLAGVGKSTACVALMQRAGARLISENIIFTDGSLIYPCYEPIRLDERSLALLGEDPRGLTPMAYPEGVKEKRLYHPSHGLPQKVRPVVLFLPQFSARRYLRELDPAVAAEKIMAMNALVRELDDYRWYAAALDLTWLKAGQAANRIQVLQSLARQLRSFELGIDRSAGVDAVVEDILGALQETSARPAVRSAG